MPVDLDDLERMNGRLVHRGPDEEGLYVDGRVGLAMRRLRVIDLAGGSQPIENEDATARIVFNGEIYNYPALRESLLARGHRFRTNTDTETILHLYEDHGARCVDHLNGMFAFAVHDTKDDSVLLARDRLGIKPLYYAETPSGLVFGSEIKAILAHPDVSRDLDPLALDEYLTFKFIPAPRTIYRAIRKLPPAHTLTWRDGRVSIEAYWKPDFATKSHLSDDDLLEQFEHLFDDAVRSQMLSDVPLGAFLSGGLDSSAIVATMAEHSDRPVETFSIGFEEASYNELSHARVVANHIGTNHHELVVHPDVADLFHSVVRQFDEPFGDSSAIPTYLVSKLAREHVTVALSGTGADELLAGYERYWAPTLSRPLAIAPPFVRRSLAGILRTLPAGHGKRSLVGRASRFLEAQGLSTFERHARLISLFSSDTRGTRYTEAFAAEVDARSPLEALEPAFDNVSATSDLDRLLGFDTSTVLADDYLTKDDRMSMAHSLEVRVPFLDHRLVEFAAACPTRLKLRGLTTKVLLRRMAKGRLPAVILRRPKHGFEVPVARWIESDLAGLVDDLLTAPGSNVHAYVKPESVRDLVERHRGGAENNAREIWSLMALEMWLQAEGEPFRQDTPSLEMRT